MGAREQRAAPASVRPWAAIDDVRQREEDAGLRRGSSASECMSAGRNWRVASREQLQSVRDQVREEAPWLASREQLQSMRDQGQGRGTAACEQGVAPASA